MQHFPISPAKMIQGFWQNRSLAMTLMKREIFSRYRGSVLGVLWSFITPIMMLAVYTFVFSVVFNARWTPESDSKIEFALVLFTGLIVFNLFAECLGRAPSLIVTHTNYVKKVVFPLDILPLVAFGSALFHLVISLAVWLIFFLFFFGIPPVTSLLLPFVLLPISFVVMGISWILASMGVFFRDVGHFIGVVIIMFMFLTPIFYPITALPDKFQTIILLNPLAIAVEQVRGILIWGSLPSPVLFFGFLSVSLFMAWLGWAWFQKTRKGFADVL